MPHTRPTSLFVALASLAEPQRPALPGAFGHFRSTAAVPFYAAKAHGGRPIPRHPGPDHGHGSPSRGILLGVGLGAIFWGIVLAAFIFS